MNRTPLILSSIAVAVLAACAAESRIAPAPAPVVVAPAPVATPYVLAPAGTVMVPQAAAAGGTVVVAPAAIALRAGFGRVESILAVPPVAGSTSNPNRRIVMRMEDGSVQYFDTEATNLAVGDRVEITKDGNLKHPA